ncbi:hypothetical protein D9758_011473 [Tetrapyrgos nigripes]|uniref:Arylamine N-acetyltransferase n=1 Tax=Tetrapyrgos nigripes TaxID=182062 RepID=A0A8H5FRE9_9AGAR|nr:hypothetical protein D9758_011473 [Tetrapyrgos nigripes]
MPTATLASGAFIKPKPSPYSKEQVIQWLIAIEFDAHSENGRSPGALPPPTVENLFIITRLHLLAFPFETTPIHYSPEHCMDVTPEGLYQRLVVRRNGSFCYGLNGLLFGMLLGLGYRAYAGQARSNSNFGKDQPIYWHTSHMVIFVQPIPDSNVTYLVDDGFGGYGLTKPILLSDEESNVVQGLGPLFKHRLRRAVHPQASTDSPDWVLETINENKDGDQGPRWNQVYTFSETEYFQCDFEAMSHFVSASPPDPKSRFSTLRDLMLLKKHTWLEDEPNVPVADRKLGGYVIIGQTLKRVGAQELEVIREIETEEERIELIKKYFDVDVDQDGIDHVRGRKVALVQA